MPPKRIFLGSRADLGARTRVYLSSEGVDVDEHSGLASGRRRRVLFDEIQLITLDRRRNSAALWVAAALGVFVALCIGLIAAARESSGRANPSVWLAALLGTWPFWLYILLHLVFGTDYITVFGKRSVAQMTFGFRKARAARVFNQLVEAVREKQAAA